MQNLEKGCSVNEMEDRRQILMVEKTNNPDFKVGDTYIFADRNRPKRLQFYIDIGTGKESYVRWKFLCRRFQLDNPNVKERIKKIISSTKGQKVTKFSKEHMEHSEKMARQFWHETMFPRIGDDDIGQIQLLSDFYKWIKTNENHPVH